MERVLRPLHALSALSRRLEAFYGAQSSTKTRSCGHLFSPRRRYCLSMTSKRPRIRFATPADREALSVLEHTYFPAVTGVYHAGYMYDDVIVATPALTERIADPMRLFTFVAEAGSEIVGFAAAIPSIKTSGEPDDQTMNLHYLAVDPEYRRQGLGAELVKRVITRSQKARQNLIHAHIPEDQVSFYEGLGWTVQPIEHGLAWIPDGDHLRADAGDPAFGFPLLASKVLRPRAILRTFPYPVVSGRPVLDASREAARLVDIGDLDPAGLDEFTRDFIKMARTGPTL